MGADLLSHNSSSTSSWAIPPGFHETKQTAKPPARLLQNALLGQYMLSCVHTECLSQNGHLGGSATAQAQPNKSSHAVESVQNPGTPTFSNIPPPAQDSIVSPGTTPGVPQSRQPTPHHPGMYHRGAGSCRHSDARSSVCRCVCEPTHSWPRPPGSLRASSRELRLQQEEGGRWLRQARAGPGERGCSCGSARLLLPSAGF